MPNPAPAWHRLRGERWCATLNHPDTDELPPSLTVRTLYCVGWEHGDLNDTPHGQGYFEFLDEEDQLVRVTGGRIAQLTANTAWASAHWAVAKGNRDSNLKYCTKTGFYSTNFSWEALNKAQKNANPPRAAASSVDFQALWNTTQQLGALEAVREQPAAIRFFSQVQALNKAMAANATPPTQLDGCCGLLITGLAGTGKSHLAHSFGVSCGGLYRKALTSHRWDGYTNQPSVLLDDMDPAQAKSEATMLKHAMDKYVFPVQRIYEAQIMIRPKLVMITSQYSAPELWTEQKTLQAMERRMWTVELKLMAGQRVYTVFQPRSPGQEQPDTWGTEFLSELAVLNYLKIQLRLTEDQETVPATPNPTTTTTTPLSPLTPLLSPVGVPETPLGSLDWDFMDLSQDDE